MAKNPQQANSSGNQAFRFAHPFFTDVHSGPQDDKRGRKTNDGFCSNKVGTDTRTDT